MDRDQLDQRLTANDRKALLEGLGFRFPEHVDETGWTGSVQGPPELGEGDSPNFSVNLSTGAIRDHGSSDWSGDLYSAIQEVEQVEFVEALDRVRDHLGVAVSTRWNPFSDGTEAARYTYRDASGDSLFEVVRFEVKKDHPAWPDKTFRQRVPEANGWGLKKHGVQPTLYRLPEVLEAVGQRVVFIVEGEKDVHTLEDLGLVATCNPGGAKKWRDEYSPLLAGAMAVILPDNDRKGREHADQVAESLHPYAEWVRVVHLPGLAKKGDVTDWVRAGGTRAKLRALVRDTARWKPEDGAGEASAPDPQPKVGFEDSVFGRQAQARPVRTGADVVGELRGRLSKMRQGTLDDYAPMGFMSLDGYMGGLRRGHLNIFAAISGAGKTTFLVQVAMNRLRLNGERPVVIFSAEMMAREIVLRMATTLARVDYNQLRTRQANAEQWARVHQQLDRIAGWPLHIDDTPSPTLDRMYNVLSQHADVQLWGIDYVEKVNVEAATEELRLSRAAQGISELAKLFGDAPNLTLSQVNVRSLRQENNWRPRSTGLRYSQKLYDEASVVLLLHSEFALAKHGLIERQEEAAMNAVEVHVAKNRDGPAGRRVNMDFVPQHTLLQDREEQALKFAQ